MSRTCCTIAILCSAALLFLVQPLAGKILLPVLGGSPAVWNTCLVFFQAALLAGYCYADLLSRRLPLAVQVGVHATVLATAAACLPIATQQSAPTGATVPWLLATLALTVGPPFFALSATAPLLQRWFALSRDPAARDPYFLYAASNAGSLGSLLAYPLAIEPLLSRSGQSMLFTAGYAAVSCGIVASGIFVIRERREATSGIESGTSAASGLSLRRRLFIVALAAVPSSLLLGVTQHLTSDVAAIPLFWVVPLAVYLGTFMLAFGDRPRLSARAWAAVLPLASAPAVFFLISGVQHPLPALVAAHLGLLLVAGMMCHRRLYEMRPAPDALTEFYLLTSLGGVLGGAFNAIVAPLLFSGVVEYPLAIAAVWWLRPQAQSDGRAAAHPAPAALRAAPVRATSGALLAGVLGSCALLAADAALHAEFFTAATLGHAAALVDPLIRAAPALAVVLLGNRAGRARAAAAAMTGVMCTVPFTGLGGAVLFQGRSFFGVHRVVLHPSGSFTLLRHGSTIHGVQARRREGSAVLATLAHEPTTYYARSGPLGDVIGLLRDAGRLESVAVIGLGAGTIAAYATPGMTIEFFEIDPLVVQIAADRRLFTYLADAAAERRGILRGTVGDGRLRLAEQPAHAYDLVIIDAFASDAIPLHLVTREAVAMYAERLRPGGLMAFNVSNRYFDLAGPIGGIAADLGLTAAVRRDIDIPPAERERAKKESVWVAVGGTAEIAALRQRQPGWEPIPPQPGAAVWTDDYANLLGVFRGW